VATVERYESFPLAVRLLRVPYAPTSAFGFIVMVARAVCDQSRKGARRVEHSFRRGLGDVARESSRFKLLNVAVRRGARRLTDPSRTSRQAFVRVEA
jgi:hypothetical protein